jgi:hypothetical protein
MACASSRVASVSVNEAKDEPDGAKRYDTLNICKEFQRHCRRMLRSRPKTMNSFDASAIAAVGIIVVQLLLG